MTTTALDVPVPVRAGSVRRAVLDILPLAASVAPFGAVVGVTLEQAGLTGPAAIAATGLVYAGSAQLATLSVLIAGGGPLGAIVAGAVVNSRMLLYSAGLAPRFRSQPAWFRWLAPLTTVDQTFGLVERAADLDEQGFRRYWLTTGAVLGAVWLSAATLGMTLGSILPVHGPLGIAAPATLVALLAPHLHDRRLRRTALTAAAVSLAAGALPAGLGIVVAILAGLAVAGTSEEVAA